MEDKSFINLLSQENLSKINIDPRLVGSFKRVMRKVQAYFNANGYTSERNYQEFFNEYLLNPDSLKNLSFFLNDEPSKIGADGFFEMSKKRICIDESIRTNEELDATLYHEFIHFLVMMGIMKDPTADPQIRLAGLMGGFINEALTEMLTRQLYPNSRAYQPQVRMMEFANLLSDNVNNYSLFLKGHIDAKGYSSAAWNNFVAHANAYQKNGQGKPYRLEEARKDESYIQAQRELINSKIHAHLIKTFSDYDEKMTILMQRPAPDNEYMEKFFKSMDRSLIANLSLNNPELSNLLMEKLQEYRDLSAFYATFNQDIYVFEIANRKIGIDKDRNLYGTFGLTYQASWNPNTGIYELKAANETVNLDLNSIDFAKWKNDIKEKKQTIAKYFSLNSKEDVKSVEQVAKQEGLVKLEKFTLPCIGTKKNPTIIYVATYNDRIEILNHPTQIGGLENIQAAQYLGVTSLDPKVMGIYLKPLGNIEKGIVFSKLNQKNLQKKTIHLLASKLTSLLTKEQIAQLVEQYKLSDEFDVEENLSPKQLQEFAMIQYAKGQYNRMSDEKKQELYEEVLKANERFVISTKDGKVDVSLLGDQYIKAFKGQVEVLVDTKGNGLYNEQFEILSKSETVRKENNASVLKTSDKGNIVFTQNKEDEKRKEEKGQTFQESLTEINKELNKLRQQYGNIEIQIENIMKKNAQIPILNYQQQLEELIRQRDEINQNIDSKMSSQKTYQWMIYKEREKEHKAVISQIERLLSIRIKKTTDTGKFIKTDKEMFSQMDSKTKATLRAEQVNINKQLNELFYNGKLDRKTWQTMKIEVDKEYETLIRQVSIPTVKKESFHSDLVRQEELLNRQNLETEEEIEQQNGIVI